MSHHQDDDTRVCDTRTTYPPGAVNARVLNTTMSLDAYITCARKRRASSADASSHHATSNKRATTKIRQVVDDTIVTPANARALYGRLADELHTLHLRTLKYDWFMVMFCGDTHARVTEGLRTIHESTVAALTAGRTVCPRPADTWAWSFDLRYFDVAVVIFGDRPYTALATDARTGHGPIRASDGLAYSVSAAYAATQGSRLPLATSNVIAAASPATAASDGFKGDLRPWTRLGILLVNRVATVTVDADGDHEDVSGWDYVTQRLVSALNSLPRSIVLVWMLWGNDCCALESRVDARRHVILKSRHPGTAFSGNRRVLGGGIVSAPASNGLTMTTERDNWFANNHFAMANECRRRLGKPPIDWNSCFKRLTDHNN